MSRTAGKLESALGRAMSRSKIIIDTDKTTVTTGELETAFRSDDASTAAAQIALLHQEIERLRERLAKYEAGDPDAEKAMRERGEMSDVRASKGG